MEQSKFLPGPSFWMVTWNVHQAAINRIITFCQAGIVIPTRMAFAPHLARVLLGERHTVGLLLVNPTQESDNPGLLSQKHP